MVTQPLEVLAQQVPPGPPFPALEVQEEARLAAPLVVAPACDPVGGPLEATGAPAAADCIFLASSAE